MSPQGERPGEPRGSDSRSPGHSPFVVDVGRLGRASGNRRRVQVSGPLHDLRVTGSEVPDGADVVVDVTLEAIGGGMAVDGTVTAPWEGVCRRCAGRATGVFRLHVRELYMPGGDGEDAYPMAADAVDLALAAHDAVVLELPPAPLCRADCLGLCPECGADRNVAPCGGHQQRDERWAGLDVLRGAGSGDG